VKFCERCGIEIATKDGDNLCTDCGEAKANGKRLNRRKQRQEREATLRDLGLVKVHGALGGTYWE